PAIQLAQSITFRPAKRLSVTACVPSRKVPSAAVHVSRQPAKMSTRPNREGKRMSPTRKQVCVVVGATSKWQADGRNTKLAHGKALDDSELPVGIRWGIGGALAQKFAKEGFLVVLTTRAAGNAAALAAAIKAQGGESMTVELDLAQHASVSRAFATIRERIG